MIHLFLCMGSGCISHELLKYFYFLPDEIQAKFLPETFQHILWQFNLRFPVKGLMGKYSLIAADGCEFNIARNSQAPSTFHPASGRLKKVLSCIGILINSPARFLCMTCFPRGIWMRLFSQAGSKTNSLLSVSL